MKKYECCSGSPEEHPKKIKAKKARTKRAKIKATVVQDHLWEMILASVKNS